MQYFRSIAILGSLHRAIEGVSYSKRVATWIGKYDHFLRRKLGFDEGNNLFLAVGRTITFLGDSALDAIEGQLALCELGKKLGYATSVRISVSDAMTDCRAYLKLIGPQSAVSTVLLDAEDQPNSASSEDLRELVVRTVDASKGLSLIGPPTYWLESGVLDLQKLNGATFTICGLPKNGRVATTAPPKDPCASRFQVFIAATGEIFPCQGLLDIPAAHLGHLLVEPEESFSNVNWSQLDAWAKQGPSVTGQSPDVPKSTLPPICRHHRENLLAGKTSVQGREI